MEATAQTDDIKAEDQEQGPQRTRARTPSSELRTYGADELAKFKKRDLTTDVELLDGSPLDSFIVRVLTRVMLREAQKDETQSRSP